MPLMERILKTNDKAYDLNQKSIQALDGLAKLFEVTMANVTNEQEAEDVLHVATLEGPRARTSRGAREPWT